VRGVFFLLSLVFYRIRTMIIHKLYVELRSGLMCMECREPRHNRHTVSLLTDRMIVLQKVSRTRKRDAQAPYLSAGHMASGGYRDSCGGRNGFVGWVVNQMGLVGVVK